MARKRERVFAIFGAGLFLLTSSALTIAVIYSLSQNQPSNSSTATNSTTAKTSTNKLEGTKLKDFTPVSQVSTLQIIDTTPGTGAEIKASDTITADYTGALASTGVVFQSSLDTGQPFTAAISGLIAGWQQGIPGMKVGGTRRLLIPAALAYGSQSQQGIPANSDLVFDITVHSAK